MPGRAGVVVVVALLRVASGCGGGDESSSNSKRRPGGVTARAARFAACAGASDYKIVRPKPPNERTDDLREAGFTFVEVDLEEPPLPFFSANVDFFPSRSDATRAKEKIGSSLAGPSTVQERRRRPLHGRLRHTQAAAGQGSRKPMPRALIHERRRP